MGKTDPGDALIPAPDQRIDHYKLQGKLSTLSRTHEALANTEAELDEQARQMHVAIEAARQQLEQSLLAIKDETVELKDEAQDKLQDLVDDIRARLDVIALVKKHPWPAVGVAFAVGFYLAMD